MKAVYCRLVLTCVAVAAFFVGSGQAEADHVAVTLNSQNSAGWSTAGSLGFEFTVNSNIDVTELGYLGTNNVHDVGIYDLSANLLTSVTIPAGTAASGDGFSYIGITPLFLHAGNSYVISGSETTSADPYIYSASPSPTYDPAITFVNERYVINAGTLAYPDTALSRDGYFGPNFQFTSHSAVPEPSSFALLGLGGIGLAFRAYRRRNCA